MEGWIKLHRKLLSNCISNKPEYAWLWITLLLLAQHSESSFIWNNKKQILESGQFLTGLKKLSKKTGIAQGTVYRILKYLENEKQIEQQKTTKYTIITILNWDTYQQNEQQNEKQIENRLKTNRKQIETYKNDKNVENDKNNSYILFLNKFNSLRNTSYKFTIQVKKLYDFWNKTFTHEQILEAVDNIPRHNWLRTIEYTPTIFLRTNKDWIDQCLNIKQGNIAIHGNKTTIGIV
jgi:DNA-binding transcriptional regulator YhcF (GntR family)